MMTRARIIHGLQALSVFAVMILGFVLVAHADNCIGATNGSLCNPSKFPDVASFIAGALKVLVQVALPFIAIFMVIAGFQFVLARGRPDKLTAAKWNFLYVVLGAMLILGAWVIATIISGTVQQIMG